MPPKQTCNRPLTECIDRLARIETKLDGLLEARRYDWVKIGCVISIVGLFLKEFFV